MATVRDHCWHDAAIVYLSDPPYFPQVCCHCGVKRTLTSRRLKQPGHGPHAPAKYSEYQAARGGEEPCIEREVSDGAADHE